VALSLHLFFYLDLNQMKLETFTVGPFAENTYLLINRNEAILIDPGFTNRSEMVVMEEALGDAELIGILLTHAHVDHVLGLNQVLQKYDVPVFLNHSDLFLWENFESQSAMFGIRAGGFSFIPENLGEQERFQIGHFSMDVLYTPGHSPDHVSLYFPEEGFVIAGDALFRESIGRTDLYKGDFDLLSRSIRNKLYRLPDDTKVYPGHGPSTTIGYEKKNNGFVKSVEG
jgi:hydroxyacylglutathione hydrolase